MINIYIFPQLKLFHAIAKSCQINLRIDRTKTSGSIFFFVKIRLPVRNFVITEGNEMKNIYNTI